MHTQNTTETTGREGLRSVAWARLDDKFHENAKQLRASHAAVRVWVCSMSYCADAPAPTGFMSSEQAAALLRKLRAAPRISAELVELGAWEQVDGGYLLHDYEFYVPPRSTDRVRQWRESKKNAGLTDSQSELLRERVFSRDGYTCRYCGAVPDRKQLVADHVNPTPLGPTTMDNLVCCCRSCNRRKGARTPEAAGMQLLPEPVATARNRFETAPRARREDPVPDPVPVGLGLSPDPSSTSPPKPEIRSAEKIGFDELAAGTAHLLGHALSESDEGEVRAWLGEYLRPTIPEMLQAMEEHIGWREREQAAPLRRAAGFKSTLVALEKRLVAKGRNRLPIEGRLGV